MGCVRARVAVPAAGIRQMLILSSRGGVKWLAQLALSTSRTSSSPREHVSRSAHLLSTESKRWQAATGLNPKFNPLQAAAFLQDIGQTDNDDYRWLVVQSRTGPGEPMGSGPVSESLPDPVGNLTVGPPQSGGLP